MNVSRHTLTTVHMATASTHQLAATPVTVTKATADATATQVRMHGCYAVFMQNTYEET